MTSVDCNDIYSRFYAITEVFQLTKLSSSDLTALTSEWIKSIKSDVRIRRLFSSIIFDSETSQLSCELKYSINDADLVSDFIIELFARGLAYLWVKRKYESEKNVAQMFTGKEEKFYSQANHLAELREMYNIAKRELYGYVNDFTYTYNSYLGN